MIMHLRKKFAQKMLQKSRRKLIYEKAKPHNKENRASSAMEDLIHEIHTVGKCKHLPVVFQLFSS
ncbi:hypothetical protein Celaphus_00017969 [Cervus elaphus hippelaphus]|uniref:Uncharacterized protein n=1 Tax=Cervus elaphus hippelaphus TaxID=46360 RepID=A0A212C883_CEREH|nr:hypothetical protein Celaphus_00017969 [Cervus elaphus hippelaphus]